MWIFLNNAYLSIVRHRSKTDYLLIRARNEGDIEATFPRAVVIKTPKADYLFRTTIHESAVARIIGEAVLNINYDNFKNSISGDRYHDACLRVWTIMNIYQHEGVHRAQKKK